MEIRILIRILTWFRTGTVTRFLTGILIGIWIPRLGSESQDLDLNPMIGTFIWYLTKSRLVSHRSLLQSVAQLTRWVELELDQIKVNPVSGSFSMVFSVRFWLWKASLKFFENETFKSYAILSFFNLFLSVSVASCQNWLNFKTLSQLEFFIRQCLFLTQFLLLKYARSKTLPDKNFNVQFCKKVCTILFLFFN